VPAEATFAAMGTRARVLLVDGPDGLLDVLVRRVLELEGRWSRFIPSSEVSRLNRAAGVPVAVSTDTVRLLTDAIAGWHATYGLFDATVLGDVERAGYDRSFEDLRARGGEGRPSRRSWLVRGTSGIEVDDAAGTARLPAGVGFDPGGIGKGVASDLVVEDALAAGASGVLVDLGGDVRVAGRPPAPASDWRIDVEDPCGGPPLAAVVLAEGAVATSARTRRAWQVDGASRHHLIDPASGAPADTDVVAATAVAGRGWQAEVLAKAAFVGGPVQGLGLVEQHGGAALVVDEAARVTTSPAWACFARPAATAASSAPA
jgi:thiamine biosynthesis lipoprotein